MNSRGTDHYHERRRNTLLVLPPVRQHGEFAGPFLENAARFSGWSHVTDQANEIVSRSSGQLSAVSLREGLHRLTKQFHVRAATRSDEFPHRPSLTHSLSLSLLLSHPLRLFARGFARLALIAGQTRGMLRLLDNLLDDATNWATFPARYRPS